MRDRTTIDRDLIVAAARRLLETEGAGALSMRRLATELDSKPMTLYHYVPSKSELLTLVLTDVAGSITWTTPSGPPRERMVAVAVDMAERLAEIPWVLPVLRSATHIGLPALALADTFLAAAQEAGASDVEAVSLWRSVWWLVSAELLFQADVASRTPDETSWYDGLSPDDLPDVPTVRALLPRWADLSAAYDLRAAVEAQVDGALLRRRH